MKTIFITGASSGIGKEISLKFLSNGYNVVVAARRIDLLEEIKNGVENSDRYHPYKLDLSNFDESKAILEKIASEYEIDILINNAGTTTFTSASEDSVEKIKNIIDINLLGSILAIKSVLPVMMKRNSGTIINILSVVTEKVFTKSSAYSASKSGLLAYANVLREEVRANNIKVINVMPGATKTPIWHPKAIEKNSERMMSPIEIAELIYHMHSLEGIMVPEQLTLRPIQGDL
ncbi:MAG: SDR family oxidoreductase [Melioribacteraceae bacterium]|nr:SDR family oxidoreductase [Melioribacteraceae bacterium]